MLLFSIKKISKDDRALIYVLHQEKNWSLHRPRFWPSLYNIILTLHRSYEGPWLWLNLSSVFFGLNWLIVYF